MHFHHFPTLSHGILIPTISLLLYVSPSFQRDANNLAATPFAALPTSFPLALKPQNGDSIWQIRNTISLYSLAIDGKNFDALDRVFVKDAIANYSDPIGVLDGLDAIKTTLGKSLEPVTTQHSLGAQVIALEGGKEDGGESGARSVTYLTASHFGMGEKVGKVLYAYGQYQDTWVKRGDEWKIKFRNLVYMGPNIGDISIFIP